MGNRNLYVVQVSHSNLLKLPVTSFIKILTLYTFNKEGNVIQIHFG